MIEVPQWFLVIVGVMTFAAAHRRRKAMTFLHDGPSENG
jgi:hypothetical protein